MLKSVEVPMSHYLMMSTLPKDKIPRPRTLMVSEAIVPASRYDPYSNDSGCIDDVGISRLRNAIVAKNLCDGPVVTYQSLLPQSYVSYR